MVSNDTRLNMTVAIIIVAVDLRGCMIDRAIASARSLNFTAMHDFELQTRFKYCDSCTHGQNIFCQLLFLQIGSKLNLYVQYSKIEIYFEIRGFDNLIAFRTGMGSACAHRPAPNADMQKETQR